jgi:hypothetical protein
MTAPQPLVDDIEAGKCLPFIGAGFSLNAKLPAGREMPAWTGLTAKLAQLSNISADLGGPAAASRFERLFGRVQLIEAIRKALHTDYAEPGESHLALAELPFDTIYTTNFDLLLEYSFQGLKKPFRSIVGELQLPFHGGPLTTSIVKMHGDLRHEEHIIVTAEDYSRYLADYPVIATHLSAQLITKTALFIGYSLTDPDFLNIRNIVRSRLGRFQRMAYVIAFDTDPEEVASKLDEHLHVIGLSTSGSRDRSALLAEFLRDIQRRIDIREGSKLRASRPDSFEPVTGANLSRVSRESDAAPLLTSSSKLCFVMMPLRGTFDGVYHQLIKPVVEEFGLTAVRADEMYSAGVIVEQIRVAIQQSRLCVADVSERNANVLYEVGIAHTLGKPTILLSRDIDDITFDIQSLRTIIYNPENLEGFRIQLSRAIELTLGDDRLDEAQRLIEGGTYRSAVALIGVVMEHDLRRFTQRRAGIFGSRAPGRPLGLGPTLQLLREQGLVATEDAALFVRATQIRNRAVHELEDPSRDEALAMLDAAKSFRAKYLGHS